MLTIVRRYEMEVAHQLTAGLPPHHKCRRLHGHRYILTVQVSGLPDEHGILIEYAELDAVVAPIIRAIDHHSLNDLNERCSTALAAAVAANPTIERLIEWFAFRMRLVSSARQEQSMRLARLTLEEDSQSSVVWEP